MQDIINEFIGGLKIGRKQSCRNLTVFALLSDYSADFDYLTLDEALSLSKRTKTGRCRSSRWSTNRTAWS
jgi:hypothetical protein